MTLEKLFLYIALIAAVLTAVRYFIQRPLSPFILFLQNFVGAFFIFSGFVKAIDPLGTSYKIQEYFVEFGLGALEPFTLAISVVTIVLEIVLGVTLILGFLTTLTMWLLLLLILFFTLLTGYTTVTGNVTDCGCFGDFLKIEPKMSFMKDILLTVLILILFWRKKYIEPLFSSTFSAAVTAVAVVGFTVFSFSNFWLGLPMKDFRPYKEGNYLPDLMKGTAKKVEYLWVYKNKSTGETKEFTDDEFKKISSEPGFKDNWEFVDRKEGKVLQEGVPAKIENFQIIDNNGDDISEDVLYNPEYQFIVVAYDLDNANEKAFSEKLNPLAEAADQKGIRFFAVTASGPEKTESFRHQTQAAFPFYSADPVFLKTIVRSNPGLMLLHNGTVKGKWHHRDIPTFEELEKSYLK